MTIATWGDLLVKKEYKMTMPILQNRDYTLSVAGTMGRNSVVAMLGNYMVIGRLKNNTITFRITDFTEEDTIVLICPEGGSITHAQLERGNKASDWTPAPEDAQEYTKDKVAEAKKYVDDLEVGGRNLIVQSTITRGKFLTVTGSESINAGWFYTDFIPVSNYKNLVTSGYSILGDSPSVVYYNSSKVFVKGINNGNLERAKNITIDSGIAFIRFSGMLVDLPTLKLEKGNKATDWTPAPEDMATVTAFSELEQNLSGFKATVQNTYADKTTVTQLAGQWSATVAKVDGHSTQITSMGTAINLRATKTEVDEKILNDKTAIKGRETTNDSPRYYYDNYQLQKVREYKNTTALGLVGNYSGLLETESQGVNSPWATFKQTFYTSTYTHSRSAIDGSTWGSWAMVADSSNIISQINISPESITIASKKIQIKGDTYIANGVIKSAHIDNLSASKITAGTLNAALVSISASSGQKQVLLNADGMSTKDSTGKLRLSIGVRDLGGVGQSDPSNIVFYSGNGKNSMYIGTNVNDTFVIAPASGKMQSLFMMPEGLTISSRQLRLTDPRGTSDYLEIRRTVDGTNEMIIYPSRPFSGQLGSASENKWFRVMRASQIVGHTLNVGYGTGSPHLGDISVGADSGSPAAGSTQAFVRSRAIYNRIYGSQPTVCVTDYGTLGRIVSARKYKEQISEATTVIRNAKDVLKIVPSEWYIKGRLDKREYGFIADDFHEQGLTEVVQYGADGQVEGLAYDRISMYLVEILKDHERQLNNMRINTNGELWQLKCQIEELKKEVKDLKQVSEEKGGGYTE